MDKDFARKLLVLVNDKYLNDLLIEYANSRINYHRKQYDTAQTMEQVKEIQGAIREISRLLKLRDEVLDKTK